jgi:excisionase family DNA binding protein
MSAPATALLTIREAAVELRCSPKTVYRRIASGELEVTDIAATGAYSTRSRVPRESLDAYIKSRTRRAGA